MMSCELVVQSLQRQQPPVTDPSQPQTPAKDGDKITAFLQGAANLQIPFEYPDIPAIGDVYVLTLTLKPNLGRRIGEAAL